MKTIVPVEGPVGYVDTRTRDRRTLVRDGFVPLSAPIAVLRGGGVGSCRWEHLGVVESLELWGNVVWAHGACSLEGLERLYVTMDVGAGSWRQRGQGDEVELIFDSWPLHGLAAHTENRSPWEHPTYLERARDT